MKGSSQASPAKNEEENVLLLSDKRRHVLAVVSSLDVRPYWLGAGLFLTLQAFWILDTLKDPILSSLTQNLERHQPTAKLFSVTTTLALVCFLEYVSRAAAEPSSSPQEINEEQVENQEWTKMNTRGSHELEQDDAISGSIFASIGVPFCIFFGLMAYLLQFHPDTDLSSSSIASQQATSYWHVLGYCFYAGVESFGSIAVATFWSYVNSTLSLADAERYYGGIIAIGQLGAITGSTLVTTHVWNHVTLIVLCTLLMILQVIVLQLYSRRCAPTAITVNETTTTTAGVTHTFQGVYMLLQYNYVLQILGVSCLYEVSLTCLNYQMTLLGWSRFQQDQGMSFTQFMGHYGQLVNVLSLFLSAIVFPRLLQHLGLRRTLRLFPSLLVLVNLLAFGALPGNLIVLFFSLAFLKAMTYSIHDPSKEILYLPTCNTIKFQSKFWIDVVGARIAKAIGSSINSYSGSVQGSLRVASAPSLLTAAALWYVCAQVGKQFDHLVNTNTIVGVNDDLPSRDTRRELQDGSTSMVILEEQLRDDDDDDVFQDPASNIELAHLQRH